MRAPIALPLVLLLLAGRGAAQETLRRVRVEHPSAPELAAELAAGGWDVLEGAVAARSLELVVSVDELERLAERGLAPEVLEVGQPFALKQAADGVPGGYPDLAAVYARMDQAAAAHPDLAQVVDLTATYGMPPTFEGRHLLALKLSDHVELDEDEPAVLVVSAHHSREVVTPVIALELIDDLLAGYGTVPELTAAVDAHELWIAPVWNPDGYAHVFAVDNLWRKNRRVLADGVGIDLNRNYPQGWDLACSGSTTPSSETFKGPGPASEPETRTMIAFSEDRNFAKVIDYHSSGREVLWGYACVTHPFDAFLLDEAVALSQASGYGGDERRPSAEGEHYEWDLAQLGSHAFLIETATEFQPSYAGALAEAALVQPGVLWMLQRGIPISGHVADACTGAPLVAEVALQGVDFDQGEESASGGPHGRYHVFAPPGPYVLAVSAPGFAPQTHDVVVTAGGAVELDVALVPVGSVGVAGPAQPGTTLALSFDMPADPGATYVAAASLAGTAPGLPFGGCVLPLNPDFLTALSSASQPPFSGFFGQLDAAGHAAGAIDLPDDAGLAGLALDLAFLTLDAFGGPLHPSAATHVVVQP